MPNAANIGAPACLVGPGRSGTTLVTAILRRHPQVQALGETANLVFSPLYHLERALPLCGPTYAREGARAAAVAQVRRSLVDLFPSEQPRWFHKPIMLPTVRRLFPQEEAFNAWFWAAAADLFPDGRWFTVVRRWQDVARSSMRRWNWTGAVAIESQARLARLLLHADSRLGLVIDFDALVAEPERTVRRLLDFLDLPFADGCLQAIDQVHAPNRHGDGCDTLATVRARGFSHADEGEPLASPALDRLQEKLRRRMG